MTKMKLLIIILILIPCTSAQAENTCLQGKELLPEYFGVYARYNNKELIKLDPQYNPGNLKRVVGLNKKRSALVTKHYSSPFHLSDSQRRSLKTTDIRFVIRKPKVILDVSKVDAFIIYGDQKMVNHPMLDYFTDVDHYKIEILNSDNKLMNLSELARPFFVTVGVGCGPQDGMEYKKMQNGAYVFKYPVNEIHDDNYRYCNLFKNKQGGKGTKRSPKFKVDFYGWFYNDVYWTFYTKN